MEGAMDAIIPIEVIKGKIYLIRGQKVLLDKDLADLYGVTTANLNKAVKRNNERFPDDFMMQLTVSEMGNLIFQSGMSSSGHGGRRTPISANLKACSFKNIWYPCRRRYDYGYH